jgi:hypothetical protein
MIDFFGRHVLQTGSAPGAYAIRCGFHIIQKEAKMNSQMSHRDKLFVEKKGLYFVYVP